VLRVGSERIADGEGARQLPDFPALAHGQTGRLALAGSTARWGLVSPDVGLL